MAVWLGLRLRETLLILMKTVSIGISKDDEKFTRKERATRKNGKRAFILSVKKIYYYYHLVLRIVIE